MGRPPVEWPIPIYTLELRERVTGLFRVPASLLAARVAAPITLEAVGGTALLAISVGNGRCLKPVGGAAQLASDFHLVEVVAPVYWQGACRPVLRGLYALDVFTNSSGIRRLLECGLHLPARHLRIDQELTRQRVTAQAGTATGGDFYLDGPEPLRERPWPARSCLPDLEAAERCFLRPESYFFPDLSEPLVRAVPVRQYSRLTLAQGEVEMAAPYLAGLLGCAEHEIVPDVALVQKRCTYTIAFPPERIPTAPRLQLRSAVAPSLQLAA